MNYPFTIDDLARIAEKSKQSIYNLLSKDKAFIRENSIKQNRKIKYNQAVLDMILSYYEKSQGVEAPNPAPEAPVSSPIQVVEEEPTQNREAEYEALKAEIEALKKQLEEKDTTIKKLEDEKAEMVKQNGLALLLLQQEKQEKLILLSAPKKSLPKRIKEFFAGTENASK